MTIELKKETRKRTEGPPPPPVVSEPSLRNRSKIRSPFRIRHRPVLTVYLDAFFQFVQTKLIVYLFLRSLPP